MSSGEVKSGRYDWYSAASYEAPKSDLGFAKVFSREEWERMSYYMQNYWNTGGRAFRVWFLWEHEYDEAAERAVDEGWLAYARRLG